jgi:hypothetical protein
LLLVTNKANAAEGLTAKVYDVQGQNNAPYIPQGASPVLTTNVPNINFQWGGGSVLGGPSEKVIVRFSGSIRSESTQDISFYAAADDGTMLYIDGQMVTSDWYDKGGGGSTSVPISFTAGIPKSIELMYYENGGGANVFLYWNQSGSMEIVPASAFTSQAAPVAKTIGSPRNLTVSDNGSAVVLNWEAPNTGNTQPERYAISFSADGGGWGIATGNVGDESALKTFINIPYNIFESLKPSGTTWTFSIRSDNDTNSLYSDISNQVTIKIGKTAEEQAIIAAEAARIAAEAEAARLAAEAEAARLAAEAARLEQEAAAKLAAEAEAARIAAEEAARLKAEADAKAAEDARLAEEARLKAEADKVAAEIAAQKAAQEKAAAEERARIAAEIAAKAEAERLANEAAIAAQQAANEKAAAEARAAEEARIAAEQAAKEAEAARLKAEEDARIQAEKDAQAKADAEKAEAEAKAKAEQDRLLEEQRAKDEADRLAQEEANAKAQAEKEAQAAKDKAAEEARIEAEQKAKEAEAAAKKAEQDAKIAEEKAEQKALDDAKKAAETGKELTSEQKVTVATILVEQAISSGQTVTAQQIQQSGIEYKDLPAATPVDVRTDENGNAVVITAEVAAQVELLQDPGALLDAALSDPGAALEALGSIGADMSDEEREEATDMVVATVVAAGAAINAAAVATGGATGGSTGGGSSGGGSGANSPGSRGGRRW